MNRVIESGSYDLTYNLFFYAEFKSFLKWSELHSDIVTILGYVYSISCQVIKDNVKMEFVFVVSIKCFNINRYYWK